MYGATLSGWSIEKYLRALKDVGLGSLPGTSAEILDDRVRDAISPGRISTRDWIGVIRAAHGLGIPTTRRSCMATWKRRGTAPDISI